MARNLEETLQRVRQDIQNAKLDTQDKTRLPSFTDVEGQYIAKIPVYGVTPENINITYDGGVLSIETMIQREERTEQGTIYRKNRTTQSFRLPRDASDDVEASYNDGVITISVKKKATE